MPTGKPDAMLVKLAQAGDGEAFSMLFQQHKNEVFGYLAGRIGNSEEAHDLTQRTFLKAWQKLPQLQDVSKFKTWLYSIARNQANDWWRNKVKTPELSLEKLEKEYALASGRDLELEVAEAQLIKLALAKLPTKYRDCLLWQINAGLSLSEIAELLEITVESASTYAHNARKRFIEVYNRLKVEVDTVTERRSMP